WFYSTPNESLRLTLYSTTLPSFTIAFCATTSTPRMFLTVFDDLLTASLMASSNPLLDVPTSSIIFPTGILSLLFSLPADYFTLSDETRHSQRSLAQGPSREKKDPTELNRKQYDCHKLVTTMCPLEIDACRWPK